MTLAADYADLRGQEPARTTALFEKRRLARWTAPSSVLIRIIIYLTDLGAGFYSRARVSGGSNSPKMSTTVFLSDSRSAHSMIDDVPR